MSTISLRTSRTFSCFIIRITYSKTRNSSLFWSYSTRFLFLTLNIWLGFIMLYLVAFSKSTSHDLFIPPFFFSSSMTFSNSKMLTEENPCRILHLKTFHGFIDMILATLFCCVVLLRGEKKRLPWLFFPFPLFFFSISFKIGIMFCSAWRR